MQCTVSLTFAENSQAVRNHSSAILPVEPLKAFVAKIKVIFSTTVKQFLIVVLYYLIDFFLVGRGSRLVIYSWPSTERCSL